MALLIANRVVLTTRAFDKKEECWTNQIKKYRRFIPPYETPEETARHLVRLIKKLDNVRDVEDVVFSFVFFYEGEWYRVPKGKATMPFSIFPDFGGTKDDYVSDRGYYDSCYGRTYLAEICRYDENKFYTDIPYLVDFVFQAAGTRALYMINHIFRDPLKRLKFVSSMPWKPGI